MRFLRYHRFFFLFFIGPLLLLTACGSGKEAMKSIVGPKAVPVYEDGKTWRGGIMGGAWGPPLEGKITGIATRARKEALRENFPVAYISLDGFQRVEVYPQGKERPGKCREVKEQIFQDVKQIREEIKEECP
ncbi:MAG: hypothetical protein AB1585_21760 [Thermodesulfobacteriota bacterium]